MKKIFKLYLYFGWLPGLLLQALIQPAGWWTVCGAVFFGLWGIIVVTYAIVVFIRWALRSFRDW